MTTNYDARIRRAKNLKETYPFAAEILTFYERICAIQQQLAKELEGKLKRDLRTSAAGTLREQLSVDAVLPFVKEAVTELLPRSPAPLAQYLKEYLRGSQQRQAASLQRYVTQGGTDEPVADSREQLVARIVVDPYAELLVGKQAAPAIGPAGNLCPHCAARPVAGVLRVEGDSGKRFLLCAFCAAEWEFRRIYCAYCGEAREQSLPVFVAEKFPQIRVEACDTCRHCIRSVDLTKDGHAIPPVDDLAAIPLALWADEYGYQRIHGNLLGT
jgi:formate dehydrogenase accessory protein FdhE